MTSSIAVVTSSIGIVTSAIARHVTSVQVTSVEVTSAEAAHASSAEAASTDAAHVSSAEAASAEAAHLTAAEAAAASVSTTAATAATATASTAAGLRTRRKQRPGKQGACQYHHRSSSSHVIFLSTDRAISDHRTSRPGQIWSPDTEPLTGNFEGSNRTSRLRWHQRRKRRCRSARG
jgi:hypothetical protein